MLVNAKLNKLDDFEMELYKIIGQFDEADILPKPVKTGIYIISHHNFHCHFDSLTLENEFPKFNDTYSEDYLGSYGVCDSIEQWEKHYARIIDDKDRKFTVAFTKVEKAKQSPEGGWRWHKWGDYIGTQNPKHEYLYDEESIELVYCYHILELPDKYIEVK